MNRSHPALVIGALMVAAMATSGCKQPPRRPPAAETPTAASTAAPATTTTAGAPAASTGANTSAPAATGGDRAGFRAARHELRSACKDDLAACQTASPGERPMRCLRKKVDELKPDCKAAMQKMMAERRGGGGRHHGGMGRGMGGGGLDNDG